MMMINRRRTAARLLTTSRSTARRRNDGDDGGLSSLLSSPSSNLRLAKSGTLLRSVGRYCPVRIQHPPCFQTAVLQNRRNHLSVCHAGGLNNNNSIVDGHGSAALVARTRITSEYKPLHLHQLKSGPTAASPTVSLLIPSSSSSTCSVSSLLFVSRFFSQRPPLMSLQYHSTSSSSSSSILRSLQQQQQQQQLRPQKQPGWTPQQLQHQPQRRWMSDNPSSGEGGGTGGVDKKSVAGEISTANQSTTKTEIDPLPKMPTATPTTPSSFDAKQQLDRAFNTATQITTRQIQRVGHALNVGDQLAVYGIILLAITLLAAPVVIQAMKNSKRKDYFTGASSEDPVDDFAELARKEWDKAKRKNKQASNNKASDNDNNDEDDDDDDEEYQHSTIEKMLKDVIGSKALQQAAQQFVVQILESDDFKTALRKLVQELWKDLLQDPETLAQVIHVLQVSFRTPQVQQAAQELVVDLVADPQVKQALITVLQRLGAEREVLQATQTLLTNATHQSLADPEILEHSMEFATDVLGDDIVQQSAGEALRNSVGHAIGHSLFNPNTILTLVGVGFFLVGMIALGNVSTSTTTAAATAMVTNAIVRGGGGTENSSSQSIVADGGTTAATAAATDATTTILQQLWDMRSTVMGTIVHTLLVSPICYLGRGMIHAVTCTMRAAYQHILIPPVAASASFLHQIWQWTGQQLMAMFVTPSNALLSQLVNLFQQACCVFDVSRYNRRIMWYDLNAVVANTVDTVWTAFYTTIATCFQWIASQSSKVQGAILTTISFGEWTGILRAWGANVLDQSRHFMTSSIQYLAQTTMQMARFFQQWFILATS